MALEPCWAQHGAGKRRGGEGSLGVEDRVLHSPRRSSDGLDADQPAIELGTACRSVPRPPRCTPPSQTLLTDMARLQLCWALVLLQLAIVASQVAIKITSDTPPTFSDEQREPKYLIGFLAEGACHS